MSRDLSDLRSDPVIIHTYTKPGKSGLLDEGARQMLRRAQDDKPLAVILNAAKHLFQTYG